MPTARIRSPLRAALVLALALPLALAAGACGGEPEPEAWRGSGAVIELTAWKLECPGCTADIEKRIGKLPGVLSVEAEVETSKVTVRIADAAKRAEVIPKIRAAIHAADKKVVGEDEP